MPKKVAVVLLNLGGPDCLAAVRPFLFNLFYDPAILRLPQPFRWLLAQTISRLRTKKAQSIYQKMGGSSPLLANTQAQAHALQQMLTTPSSADYQVFIAMRYWHPFTFETMQKVQAFKPDEVVLMPLYPHFSTTTTASSLKEWQKEAQKLSLHVPTYTVCCYATDPDFIQAHVQAILPFYHQAKVYGQPRLLFSAHSLPQKVIDAGDPYQWHIEQSVIKIIKTLKEALWETVDYEICYQSRVGPIKWLAPTTQQALTQAGNDGVPVVIIPISFVSEHSETLVELDIDYQQYAQSLQIPYYGRVPALACQSAFIESMARHIQTLNQDSPPACSECLDPKVRKNCPRMILES